MRKRIFEIIERSNNGDRLSYIYDVSMIFIILISLVPLAFKETNHFFELLDQIVVCIFIIDYLLRWITADYKLKDTSSTAFIRYPFTWMAIVDLISILPSLTILNNGIKVLRVLRMIRALRVLRVIKTVRYSNTFDILSNVLRHSKDSLIAVGTLAVGYILISALIILNVEPDSFTNFFDALYWATVSLTTIGYGDIYPVSTLGRFITMLSSIFGIAIVALPSGIITAGYMHELEVNREKEEEEEILKELQK